MREQVAEREVDDAELDLQLEEEDKQVVHECNACLMSALR
jgi:hypothetical protein